MLSLKDSSPGHPLLLHEEPIYLNNEIIGRTDQEIIHLTIKKIYLLVI